jgi:hypothetical protein
VDAESACRRQPAEVVSRESRADRLSVQQIVRGPHLRNGPGRAARGQLLGKLRDPDDPSASSGAEVTAIQVCLG